MALALRSSHIIGGEVIILITWGTPSTDFPNLLDFIRDTMVLVDFQARDINDRLVDVRLTKIDSVSFMSMNTTGCLVKGQIKIRW